MNDQKRFRVFATSQIGDPAENRLRERGYELEVFQGPEAPPKELIIEKVKSGIDGLITTLRDPIDAEIFEAGKGSLRLWRRSRLASTTSTAPTPTNTRSHSRTPPTCSPKRPPSSLFSCSASWRAKCI